MSVIDEVLSANAHYAETHDKGDLAMPPARGLAVLTCMDARLSVEAMLGLETGDAHIIRNAGGVATVDAVRSLILSHHLLATQEVMVINHTDCGMLTFRDDDLRQRLEEETGTAAVAPAHFHAFDDLEQHLKQQVRRIRSHPWLPEDVPVRGFLYDVATGALRESVVPL